MELTGFVLAIVAAVGARTALAFDADSTAVCGWYLNPNDCICMSSADGRVMSTETSSCCQEMGLKAAGNKCAVDKDIRQTFKDCCKWLQEDGVIGHCH